VPTRRPAPALAALVDEVVDVDVLEHVEQEQRDVGVRLCGDVSSSTMSRRCGVQLSEVDLVDVEVWDRHASRAKTATRACDPVVKQDLAAPRPSLLRPQGAGAGGC
jgi:hypothetical protein